MFGVFYLWDLIEIVLKLGYCDSDNLCYCFILGLFDVIFCPLYALMDSNICFLSDVS